MFNRDKFKKEWKDWHKVVILSIILISGIPAIMWFSSYLISDLNLKSNEVLIPIIISQVGYLVTVITTIYKRVDNYFSEKRKREQNRWEIVFPLIKDSYMSWINSAYSLMDAFRNIKDGINETRLNRILYLICVFYGNRMKFIKQHGGLVLLGKLEDEENVIAKYEEIKKVIHWAGDKTPEYTSELQSLFMNKSKDDNVFVLKEFVEELESKQGTNCIKDQRDELEGWLNSDKENAVKSENVLKEFADVFKKGIDELSRKNR